MSFNYLHIANTALAQIKRFGQQITITHRSAGAYDINTGAVVVTETTETGYAVTDTYASRDIDGTLIQAGDFKLVVAAVGISELKIDDVITLANGEKVTVKQPNPVTPSGMTVIYEAQVRR